MTECTGCMDCEQACPLTPFGFGIGNIIRKYLAGKEDEMIDTLEIWHCTMCFSCDDACPIGFKPRERMIHLRRRSQNYPQSYKRLIAGIRNSGNAFFLKKKENGDYAEIFKRCVPSDK